RVLSAAEEAQREEIRNQYPEHIRKLVIGPEIEIGYFKRVFDIFRENPQIASSSRYDIGKSSLLTVDIPVNTNVPFAARPHFQSPLQRQFMENEIENLIQQGVMVRWSSPWASPAFVVKSGGKLRMVVDYRGVNKLITAAAPQTPAPEHIFSSMRPRRFHASLDLVQSFYHISLSPETTDRLAIITSFGQFSWLRMPFGISVAPSCLQTLTRWCISGINEPDAEFYNFVDDVIISADSQEVLIRTFEKIMANYVKAGLKINTAKTHIGLTKIKFLGFEISSRGFRITDDRVEAVRLLQVPKNVKQLRSLVGFYSYLRSFIRRFAEICVPLLKLLRQGAEFEMGPDQIRALEQLKSAVCDGNILTMPTPGHTLVMATDASTICLAATLAQTLSPGVKVVATTKLRPIAFVSRTLNDVDQLKNIWFLELSAILLGVKKFHTLINYQRFVIMTDSTTVVSLLKSESRQLPPQVARMKLLLECYSFTVIYRASSYNCDADGLSRNPVYEKPALTFEEEYLGEDIDFREIKPPPPVLAQPMMDQPIQTRWTKPTEEELMKKLQANLTAERPKSERGEGVGETGENPCPPKTRSPPSGTASPNQDGDGDTSMVVGPPSSDSDGYAAPRVINAAITRRQTRQAVANDDRASHEQNEPREQHSLRRSTRLAKRRQDDPLQAPQIPPRPNRTPRTLTQRPAHTRLQGQLPQRAAPSAIDPGDQYYQDTGLEAVDEEKEAQVQADDCIEILTVSKLMDGQRQDSEFADIYRFIKEGKIPARIGNARRVVKRSSQYSLRQDTGLLYYKGGCDEAPRLCVPRKYVQQLLARYHGRIDTGCHQLIDKMLTCIRPHWYWRTLSQDIATHTKQCTVCAKTRKLRPNRVLPLTPLAPRYVGHTVQVDLLELVASREGYRYALVMVDDCSKFIVAKAIMNKEAATVARAIVEEWYLRLGPCEVLASDNGSEFAARLQQEVCALYGIKQRHGTPYHSMSQGSVERTNARILDALRRYVTASATDWPEYLPFCVYALNTQVSASAQDSAYRLMFGHSPRMPTQSAIDAIYDDRLEFRGDYVATLQRALRDSYQFARANMLDARDRQKHSHDEKAKPKSYVVGDLVLRKITTRPIRQAHKLAPVYDGPWRVTAVRGNVVDIEWDDAVRRGRRVERRRTNVLLLRDYVGPFVPAPQRDLPPSAHPMSNIRQSGRTLPALHRDEAQQPREADEESLQYVHIPREYRDIRGKEYIVHEPVGERILGTLGRHGGPSSPEDRSTTSGHSRGPAGSETDSSSSSDPSEPPSRRRGRGQSTMGSRSTTEGSSSADARSRGPNSRRSSTGTSDLGSTRSTTGYRTPDEGSTSSPRPSHEGDRRSPRPGTRDAAPPPRPAPGPAKPEDSCPGDRPAAGAPASGTSSFSANDTQDWSFMSASEGLSPHSKVSTPAPRERRARGGSELRTIFEQPTEPDAKPDAPSPIPADAPSPVAQPAAEWQPGNDGDEGPQGPSGQEESESDASLERSAAVWEGDITDFNADGGAWDDSLLDILLSDGDDGGVEPMAWDPVGDLDAARHTGPLRGQPEADWREEDDSDPGPGPSVHPDVEDDTAGTAAAGERAESKAAATGDNAEELDADTKADEDDEHSTTEDEAEQAINQPGTSGTGPSTTGPPTEDARVTTATEQTARESRPRRAKARPVNYKDLHLGRPQTGRRRDE
ncbi:MAG TPA: hypothetical protein ENK17_00150, partial [Anaerolineae bacterium]|nr:hypothetical protein [Anaerolineae bacterium]